MGKWAEIGPFLGQNEADVDINTQNSLNNLGSNETMQNVLAPIVKLWQIYLIYYVWVKFCVNWCHGE